jgi:ABC-type phosphate transport system substrate-binding protein
MDEDWRSLIREATKEIKGFPDEKAAMEKRLKDTLNENRTQVKAVFSDTLIPALNELKKEMDAQDTPAEVASSEEGGLYSASITVNLSNLLRDSTTRKGSRRVFPKFFYEIGLSVSAEGVASANKCSITDAAGQSRELYLDKDELFPTIPSVPVASTLGLKDLRDPDLNDKIKRDFGLKYKESVGYLRNTAVYG